MDRTVEIARWQCKRSSCTVQPGVSSRSRPCDDVEDAALYSWGFPVASRGRLERRLPRYSHHTDGRSVQGRTAAGSAEQHYGSESRGGTTEKIEEARRGIVLAFLNERLVVPISVAERRSVSRASCGTETRPVVWHLQEVLSVDWVHVLLDDVNFST